MRWDKDKLEGIAGNLDFGLNESIYRNALPINMDRADISSASLTEGFATQFIKEVLDRSEFSMEIQVSESQAKKFHHLYVDHLNNKKDKGSHTLGFGYPLFINKDENFSLFPVVAPLFIWQLELQPSPNRTNTWIISRKQDMTVRSNGFLLNYLKNTMELEPEKAFRDLVNENKVNGRNLSALCNNLSVQLGIRGNISGYAIVPCPTADEMRDLSEEATIRFSGIIGSFEQEHFSLASYINEKIASLGVMEEPAFSDEEKDVSIYKHPFSLLKPDPCQKHIAKHVAQNSVTVAEGSTGTGKTSTAMHLATNTIANGGTCLIVSPRKSGLEAIQQHLISKKVGAHAYLFCNPDKELNDFYYSLKQLPIKLKKATKEESLGFKILMGRCISTHNKLDARHRLVNRRAFGTLDFTDTVGHYIESSRHAGKDILSGRLNVRDYKFTFREYDILKTDIVKGERLYREVNQLEHPLEVLHEEIFSIKTEEKGREFTEKQLEAFKLKTEKLLRRFTDGLETYMDNLSEHYEQHAHEMHLQVQAIKDKITEYGQVFGEDFKSSGNVKVQMYGVFSETYYNIKEARREIMEDFHKLEDSFTDRAHFSYKFPRRKDTERIAVIQQAADSFEKSLRAWVANIPNNVKAEAENLSSKSMQLEYNNSIGELEYAHDILLEELNQVRIFRDWIAYDGETIPKRLASLESLWELLDTIQRNMKDFSSFHPWQKHWLEALPISKVTITGLILSRCKDWLPAFNSWYFYSCLSGDSFMPLIADESLEQQYLQELLSLRNQLPNYINAKWHKRQDKALTSLKKKNKRLYQLLFGKKSKLPRDIQLKDIFDTLSEEMPELMPVTLMTTDVAIDTLLGSGVKYDLIIFDDAHNIPVVQAAAMTDFADKVLVIGDRRQNLFGESQQSFMEMVVETGKDILPLYYRHTKTEDACHEFINRTSYQQSIKSIHYFDKPYMQPGIFLKRVEGRYNEEKRMNNLEVEHLVRVLSEIPAKQDGQMPHTAIVANTVEQRDHISSYLLYIKQKRNPYCDKVIKLEEAGLRILSMEELTEHYEYIVWSMTFGTTNLRGHVTNHFSQTDGRMGQNMVNTVLGHVGKHLIVCSSIPKNHISSQLGGNPSASGAIVQFLRYADITDGGREDERQEFLNSVEWPGAKENDMGSSNMFMEQVKQELLPYFETDRIKTKSPLSEIRSAAITISPLDYNQPMPLIIGDAIDRNHPSVAYEFEHAVMEKLENAGYKVFRTNSPNWWKNPKREARLLASQLIKADNTPPEVEAVK